MQDKKMKSLRENLPISAKYFLCRICLLSMEEGYIGDIEEEYINRLNINGKISANIWLLRQIILSIPGVIKSSCQRSTDMFKNYLKIAFRNMKRNKTHSFVNITGLSLGIASCLLIFAYVNFEFSFDKYHGKADRIYRFAVKGTQGNNAYSSSKVHSSLSEYLDTSVPEIEKTVRFFLPSFDSFSYNDNIYYEDGIYLTDNTVFDVFDFELVQGDPVTALKLPNTIVLSQEMAVKYFKNEDPIGKTIKCDGTYDFTVTGIIKKPPVNSHLQFDALVSMETLKKINNHIFEYMGHFDFYTYLLLQEKHDLKSLETKLDSFFQEKYGNTLSSSGRVLSVLLQPLKAIHLKSNLLYDNPGNANITYIYGLITSAIMILLIAIINFVNLSSVMLSKRTREIGMRKVLGAIKEQIVVQFFGESVLYTVLAFIIGAVLVIFAFPYQQFLSGYNLDLGYLKGSTLLIQSILIILFISISASAYSAFFLSSFNPIKIIKGVQLKGNNLSLSRNALVVVQFLISISLIIVTMGVFSQINFLKSKGLGFNAEQLVYAPVYTDQMGYGSEKADNWMNTIKQELHMLEGVENTSFSSGLPSPLFNMNKFIPEGTSESFSLNAVTYEVGDDFLNTLEVGILQGRGFLKEFPGDRDNSVIINETAAQMIGWQDPIGKSIKSENGKQSWKVVGIMKDIHCRSLHNNIEPMVFLNFPHAHYMVIRIRPENIDNTLAGIKNVWRKLEPNHAFEYGFLKEKIDNMYSTEAKLGSIIQIFVLLAVAISCLGIFGFISYMIEQRTKEIGIRKTFGASVGDIVNIILKNLSIWVIIASILAFPAGYYILNKWLESFAFRIEIGIGIFVLSGLSAFLLALMTIIFQTVKAARAKPVDTLRYE